MKQLKKWEKKMEVYFAKHSRYNAFVHFFIGIGFGILVTYPVVGGHPVRWGASILAIGLLMHLYPLF